MSAVQSAPDPRAPLPRRRLFALAGAAVAAATAGPLLQGCGVRPAATASSSSASSGAVSSSPSTPSDWAQLRGQLNGSLVLPGDSGYAVAHELFDPQYDSIHPQGVAFCQTASDLQRCVDFVRQHALPIAMRSGGHSYAGYSTTIGLLVDVSRMNKVAADAKAGTATVGAGTRMVDVYAQLAAAGATVPGTSCPDVGIAGAALGGGIGVVDRKFGLTLDNTVAVDIVTADGTLRHCDAANDPDLYWACRGGGGGNFGAVAQFQFRTHATANLALFDLGWDWSAASQVVPAWLAWAPNAPDELWSNCVLGGGGPGGTPSLHTSGVYIGTEASLNALVDQFQKQASVNPASRSVWTSGFLDAMLSEAGCLHMTVAQCHTTGITPGGVRSRGYFAAKSDFISQPLGAKGVAALLGGLEDRARTYRLGGGAVLLDACGGAPGRVAADATAYVHRSDLCSVQYYTSWSAGASPAFLKSNQDWLDTYYQSMRPYVSGYAYQNYIDAGLTDWQHAYYGANFAKLVEVKAKYDPDDLFRFAQSIPLKA